MSLHNGLRPDLERQEHLDFAFEFRHARPTAFPRRKASSHQGLSYDLGTNVGRQAEFIELTTSGSI